MTSAPQSGPGGKRNSSQTRATNPGAPRGSHPGHASLGEPATPWLSYPSLPPLGTPLTGQSTELWAGRCSCPRASPPGRPTNPSNVACPRLHAPAAPACPALLLPPRRHDCSLLAKLTSQNITPRVVHHLDPDLIRPLSFRPSAPWPGTAVSGLPLPCGPSGCLLSIPLTAAE